MLNRIRFSLVLLLIIPLLLTFIPEPVQAQTTTHSVVSNQINGAGHQIKWAPQWLSTADSSVAKWSNSFNLADIDGATTVTGYYTYDLATATWAQYSMKVIHYVNNYSSLDTDLNWLPKDTITISGGTPVTSSITFTKGCYHKLKAENAGSPTTLILGIYFVKPL